MNDKELNWNQRYEYELMIGCTHIYIHTTHAHTYTCAEMQKCEHE